jgi:hypothetical protein
LLQVIDRYQKIVTPRVSGMSGFLAPSVFMALL